MRKAGAGKMWIQRPSFPTRTGPGRVSGRRRADCWFRPAAASTATKGFALPSIAGISGPSTRTSRLSMPSPAAAAIRCSTVPTRVPFFPMVVA